ncbi:MAG: homocysteine S-methyltransferase family protein [Pseudomonadota bacterium]
MAGLPKLKGGQFYLTEGGVETAIMFKWGFELPEFAVFPLLDKPEAVEAIRGLFRAYLDTVARSGQAAYMGGLDFRASPDWGAKLGYSPAALRDLNIASVDFLRGLAAEYRLDIPKIRISGVVGPRGDAYALNRNITADSAEEYHSVQLSTLKHAGAHLATALTFNNVPEAIGVTRAARQIGIPLGIGFIVTGEARLKSGPTLEQAIAEVDAATGGGPEFYIVNCSHPLEFLPALGVGTWESRLRGFRPNASKMDKIALCKIGHLEEGDPEELSVMMGDLAARYPHMDIWGGCCGTGAVHLGLIAERVRAARQARAA